MRENLMTGFLSLLSQLLLLAGATGSLIFMFHTARHNNSLLLMTIFVVWVLSPFLSLSLATIFYRRWSIISRMILFYLVIVVTAGSLAGYSGILNPPGVKPAFIFLVVPLISWVLIAIVMLMAIYRARKLSRRN